MTPEQEVLILSQHLDALKAIVNEQSDDERLWFMADYVTEEHLQAELRKLHRAIEDFYDHRQLSQRKETK